MIKRKDGTYILENVQSHMAEVYKAHHTKAKTVNGVEYKETYDYIQPVAFDKKDDPELLALKELMEEEDILTKILKEEDFDTKEKTGRFLIRLKRHEFEPGTTNRSPLVVDAEGKEIDPANPVLIGNGSIVNVQFKIRESSFGGKKTKTLEHMATQIVKLVPYTPPAKPNPFGATAKATPKKLITKTKAVVEEEIEEDLDNPFL